MMKIVEIVGNQGLFWKRGKLHGELYRGSYSTATLTKPSLSCSQLFSTFENNTNSDWVNQMVLTLSQTTIFKLFENERLSRRQFQI